MKNDVDTDITDYFRSNLISTRKFMSDRDFDDFNVSSSRSQKVVSILKSPEPYKLSLEIENREVKNLEQCLIFKKKGNDLFGEGAFENAFKIYTSAVLLAPKEEIAVLFANRSAALYHLQKYELSLSDMTEAIQNSYPQKLMYKIEERRARCHLAMKNHSKAYEYFQKTLQNLDYAQLPIKRKKQIEMDARVMLAVMEKGRQLNKNCDANETNIPKSSHVKSIPKIQEINPLYPALSKAVEIVEGSESVGRHGLATRDIMPGEILAVEEPKCAVLLKEYRLTHCHVCHVSIEAPIPARCFTCTSIAYCSSNCRESDEKVHEIECQLLGPLWCSGTSVTCIMALKAIITTPFDEILKLKGHLNLDVSKERPYEGKNYETLYNLVSHENERTADDLFHRAYMAAWLLRLLKTTAYIPEKYKTENKPGVALSEEELFIADLLYTNLQVMQFNSHEISELKKRKSDSAATNAKSMFIGGGIYPTIALLNHSCNPGVIRYFIGTTMILQSVRTIYKDTEVSENYGAIFTETPFKERQQKMRGQYWFDCKCEACQGHWPILKEIDQSILRFKCVTGPKCGNVIPIETKTKDFLFTCRKCGKSINVLGGLKALQETDLLFDQATKQLEKGHHSESLKLYLNILQLLDKFLALPMKDYHVCQQGVRLCTLSLGNISFK